MGFCFKLASPDKLMPPQTCSVVWDSCIAKAEVLSNVDVPGEHCELNADIRLLMQLNNKINQDQSIKCTETIDKNVKKTTISQEP